MQPQQQRVERRRRSLRECRCRHRCRPGFWFSLRVSFRKFFCLERVFLRFFLVCLQRWLAGGALSLTNWDRCHNVIQNSRRQYDSDRAYSGSKVSRKSSTRYSPLLLLLLLRTTYSAATGSTQPLKMSAQAVSLKRAREDFERGGRARRG